jgi:hypothetical protein
MKKHDNLILWIEGGLPPSLRFRTVKRRMRHWMPQRMLRGHKSVSTFRRHLKTVPSGIVMVCCVVFLYGCASRTKNTLERITYRETTQRTSVPDACWSAIALPFQFGFETTVTSSGTVTVTESMELILYTYKGLASEREKEQLSADLKGPDTKVALPTDRPCIEEISFLYTGDPREHSVRWSTADKSIPGNIFRARSTMKTIESKIIVR